MSFEQCTSETFAFQVMQVTYKELSDIVSWFMHKFQAPPSNFPISTGGRSLRFESLLPSDLSLHGWARLSLEGCNGMQQGTHVNFRLIDALNFSFNILHRGHLQVGGFFVNHKPVHFKDIGVEISYQGTVFLTFSLVIRYQTVIFSCYS